MLGLSLLLATTTALGTATAGTAATRCSNDLLVPSAGNIEVVAKATACLVNQRRSTAGLRPLATEVHLRRMADAFAAELVRDDFFDHTSPSGVTFQQRFAASGYTTGRHHWSGGENLAWGTGAKATPRAIVAAWMASPGHRKNILGRDYRDTGIGIVIGAPDPSAAGTAAATYVQEFGSRR